MHAWHQLVHGCTQHHCCTALVQLSLDVRGKQTLEESLDLYVQGELMEGDNQYFCEEASQKVAFAPLCLSDPFSF